MTSKRTAQHFKTDDVSHYQFMLLLNGAEEITEQLENAIFEAGCDDALLSSVDGQVYLEFDRQANSLCDAILSAIHAVEASLPGLKVIHVYPPNAREIESINAALKVRNESEANHLLQELRSI